MSHVKNDAVRGTIKIIVQNIDVITNGVNQLHNMAVNIVIIILVNIQVMVLNVKKRAMLVNAVFTYANINGVIESLRMIKNIANVMHVCMINVCFQLKIHHYY